MDIAPPSTEHGTPETPLTYLDRADVTAALAHIDPVQVAAATLREHADGRTELPAEAYLGWQTSAGASARSLAMPGLVRRPGPALGVKIINASLGNAQLGLPRADGLIVLFEPETARPIAVMHAAVISATRTAAVSVTAVHAFAGPGADTLALLGCGAQAAAHLELLLGAVPSLRLVRAYDLRDGVAAAFAERWQERAADRGVRLAAAGSAQDAVADADVVVTVTTVTEGYLPGSWLAQAAVVLHVSLDDLMPDAVLTAGRLVVDDWDLVRTDRRRLFGRLHHDGLLVGPSESPPAAGRRVDGELGDFLTGRRAVTAVSGPTVVNPFGMAIQDIALAHQVLAAAQGHGLGRHLDR